MIRRFSDSFLSSDFPRRPDFSIESQLLASGAHYIAGIDEAGRGPLAGPVVVAAVILDPHRLPNGLDDSKRLTPVRREAMFQVILTQAIAVSVASLSATSIDGSDIRKATLESMRRAVISLTIAPCYVLVDGRDMPQNIPYPGDPLIKGDQRSISISAASIVAKVIRDRMMKRISVLYPAYGFADHAGYGTIQHRAAIKAHGPVRRLHRFTFAPIKNYFTEDNSSA